METCPTDHPALGALFDPRLPNPAVLWAVLEGRHADQTLVDDARHPTQCVLRTDAVLTFFSRRASQPFLDAAIVRLRRSGPVWLVWPFETQLRPPDPASLTRVPRLAFSDLDTRSQQLADWRSRRPADCQIRPLDRDLLARCQWRDVVEFYCGGIDAFLQHAFGLCLLQDDEIIVEAYATALGANTAEIGAITRADHRGRNLAPITCAYLIQACAARNLQPYWSCDLDNPASARVANKLGFRRRQPYQILEYDALTGRG